MEHPEIGPAGCDDAYFSLTQWLSLYLIPSALMLRDRRFLAASVKIGAIRVYTAILQLEGQNPCARNNSLLAAVAAALGTVSAPRTTSGSRQIRSLPI